MSIIIPTPSGGLTVWFGLLACMVDNLVCPATWPGLFGCWSCIQILEESGKRKAIDNGPWMFDKDLVVVEEFDPSKRIEDYAFNNIPIWVRVFNLPLGMMNIESAEEIGNIIGQFVEADTGLDGNAIGRYMRVKIRMCIDRPIMRGFTLEDDEVVVEKRSMQKKKEKEVQGKEDDEEGGWCRFEYEFLPDFCYTCGRIGHGEKDCATKLQKGDIKQYGRWLRADMGQRRGGTEEGSWRNAGRFGGGSRSYGFSKSGGRSGSGSESLSWRKSGSRSSGGGYGKYEGEEEVTSPSKLAIIQQKPGIPKKLNMDAAGGHKNHGSTEGQVTGAEKEKNSKSLVQSSDMVIEQAGKQDATQEEKESKVEAGISAGKEVGRGKGSNPGGKKYKKIERQDRRADDEKKREVVLGQKRSRVEDGSVKEQKKGRVQDATDGAQRKEVEEEKDTNTSTSAGLLEQPRR